MTDYLIIALLIVLTVLAVIILVKTGRPLENEEEDDGREEEAFMRLMGKLDENKEAVKVITGQFDVMTKSQYAQNRSMQESITASLKERELRPSEQGDSQYAEEYRRFGSRDAEDHERGASSDAGSDE